MVKLRTKSWPAHLSSLVFGPGWPPLTLKIMETLMTSAFVAQSNFSLSSRLRCPPLYRTCSGCSAGHLLHTTQHPLRLQSTHPAVALATSCTWEKLEASAPRPPLLLLPRTVLLLEHLQQPTQLQVGDWGNWHILSDPGEQGLRARGWA